MALVLIATDDFTLYRILAAECEGEGHEARWAAEGFEASQMALNDGVDLALLDTRLATYNGFELCEMLRADPQIPHELPIFLLTDDEVNPRLVQRIQATDVFPKTHGAHEIRELLSRYLIDADLLERQREALALAT